MELTGNFFEHMDKSSNVKKMKGFFQQKHYFEGYDLKPKNMNNSHIYSKVYHIMSTSKGSWNIWSISLKSKKNKLGQKICFWISSKVKRNLLVDIVSLNINLRKVLQKLITKKVSFCVQQEVEWKKIFCLNHQNKK